MDRFPDLPRSCIQQLRQCSFPDQVGHMRTDHLHPKNITAGAVSYNLNEAILHSVDNRLADG
ncbi:hypothetical protein D3C74_471960 [compost metagenome]